MTAPAKKKRSAHRPPASRPWKAQDTREIAAHRVNSRQKGAGGELEFARLVLAETGVRLERKLDQARGGGHDLEPVGDSPAAKALGRFAIECKRYKAFGPALLARHWRQAEEQARKAARTPLLAYRADRQAWAVLVPLSALNRAYGPWEGIEWTAQLSAPAFCALVREMAASGGAQLVVGEFAEGGVGDG